MTVTPLEWIAAQQSRLDALIADAAASYARGRQWPPQDLTASAKELFRLGQADVCYDRPSIALPYALFYQGRRLQDTLLALHDPFVACPHEPLDVVDLGVGTGATPLAVGLLLQAYAGTRRGPSAVTVIGLDASAFMIDFCQHLLEQFRQAYPDLPGRLDVQLEVNSWRNVDPMPRRARRWLIGNYVFDPTECQRSEELSLTLVDITSRVNAEMVFLQGARSHGTVHATLSSAFARIDWVALPTAAASNVFAGPMPRCAQLRKDLRIAEGQDPVWNKGETIAARFVPRQPDLLQEPTPRPERIDLFLAPVRVRRDVRLTPEQERAATPDGRPTILVGPAGCGKSLVLTERVKRLVTSFGSPSSLRILVTTFNRELVDQLAMWLRDILPDFTHHAQVNGGDHDFTGPQGQRIKVINFDKIPTRLFDVGRNFALSDNVQPMQTCLDEVCAAAGVDAADHPDILQPAFLLTEYARVFYGQRRWRSREDYLRSPRVGRGAKPPLRGEVRGLVWDTLASFDRVRRERKLKNFEAVRREALECPQSPTAFTHVFYDEFQDLMPADFDLLYRLAADPNEIVLAGDLAQAFFVGRSYHVPRDDEMARRQIVTLEGSHRLPTRISEALRPLAERLARTHGGRHGVRPAVVEPSRWAPPGARPIVVYAPQPAGVATEVRAVLASYAGPLDLHSAIVVEPDTDIMQALRTDPCPMDSIRSASMTFLKGLERDCVLWAGWQPTPASFADAALEMAYTALTRASGLLVLMLSDTLPSLHRELLGLLDPNRLIFWTPEAREAFERLKIAAHGDPDRADDEEDLADISAQP